MDGPSCNFPIVLSNSQLLSSRCISTLLKESFLAVKQSGRLIDGSKLTFIVCAGLLYSQVVSTPQNGQCGFLQTDSVNFQRPAQPSNSLASVTDVALQSIFRHLDVASAARLASTCKVCFDEHRHQCAEIYERAHQQLTPEETYAFHYTYDWELGVAIIVHWADEELLLQMYRIALHRKALQESGLLYGQPVCTSQSGLLQRGLVNMTHWQITAKTTQHLITFGSKQSSAANNGSHHFLLPGRMTIFGRRLL